METRMTTGMKDHTGAELFVADCVRIESHDYEWNGYITRHSGLFWVKYVEDGIEVKLSKIHNEVEKLKTFEDAVEMWNRRAPNAPTSGSPSVVTCDKPPMRDFEARIERLRKALVGLIGAETEEELKAMEVAMRMVHGIDADKAAAVNAIHALLSEADDKISH